MSAATVAIGVGVAAAAGSAIAKKNAANKAANARQDALNGLELLDIPGLSEAAAKADEAEYKGQLELQKRAGPLSAEAREAGLAALTSNIDTGADAQAQQYLSSVAADASDPAFTALHNKFLAVAQESLDAGAEMTPEFQAELVRTGLESAGTAGFAPDRAGAAGQTLRRLTGAAGEALVDQRVGRAVTAGGAAQSLVNTRANILTNLVSQLTNLQAGKTARAGAAFQAGASQTPNSFGLSGADVTRLSIANTNLNNARTLGTGEIKAGRALSSGEFTSSLLGAASSGATGLLGLYGKKG